MSQTTIRHTYPNGTLLEICQGDLTQEPVDAIVNAANEHLLHGGGIAGAIVRRGGEIIQQESNAWVEAHGPVRHAHPAVTTAGSLPCSFVIHAVGPVWGTGDEDDKLAQAIRGALEIAARMGLASIAFPAISTGIFGFPKTRAAGIFFDTFSAFFQQPSEIMLVRLVLFDELTLQAFLLSYEQWHSRLNEAEK